MRAGLVALALLAAASADAAGPPPPGAASCSGCHAPNRADGPLPGIHGRPAEEIVAALRAFRSGSRPATVMNRIAPGFTEEEAQAIAAWLAEQR